LTEYTPTTEEVYEAYASGGDGGIASLPDHSRESFDRWLQSVKADAWDEGFDSCANWWEIHHHRVFGDENNPFRERD